MIGSVECVRLRIPCCKFESAACIILYYGCVLSARYHVVRINFRVLVFLQWQCVIVYSSRIEGRTVRYKVHLYIYL